MDFTSIASRALFAVAIILVGLGVVEWLLRPFEYTVVGEAFSAGRLLEFGVSAVVFLVALLLRQIREELRKDNG